MLCKHVQMRCWHCSKIVSKFMLKSFQAHFFIIQSAILSVAIVRVFMTIMFDCHMQVLPHPTSILDGNAPQSSQHNLNIIPHKLRRISKWSPNNPQILPNSYQNHSQKKLQAIQRLVNVDFWKKIIKIVGELIISPIVQNLDDVQLGHLPAPVSNQHIISIMSMTSPFKVIKSCIIRFSCFWWFTFIYKGLSRLPIFLLYSHML